MRFWIYFAVGAYLNAFAGGCGEVGEGEMLAHASLRFEEAVVHVFVIFGRESGVI